MAERHGQRVILARNLLGTLRGREIDATAKTIAAQTGLVHRTVADVERVTGTYRRNGRPVIVLSNNNGCAVARSQEAKDMGIVMGEPWFRLRHLERRGLIALSSNYALYADMSARMMSVIGQFCPRQEVYSIDESFLEFEGFARWNLSEHCRDIRDRVRKWVGIPVCVGLGASKTLAKLANRIAKKTPEMGGVCNLSSMSEAGLFEYLGRVDVRDVWGIGSRLTEKLASMRIITAADLTRANPDLIRMRFGVQVERTVRELNGLPCFDLETEPPPKQQIVSSRSFGRLVEDKRSLAEALHTYVARAGEKVRRQDSVCSTVGVFLMTNRFMPDEPQYHPMASISLPSPAQDGFALAKAALRGLDAVYKPEFRYQKAGVMLMGLAPAAQRQESLFGDASSRREDLSKVLDGIDGINERMGRDSVRLAVANQSRPWAMKRGNISPAYTSSWKQVAIVR